MKRIQLEPWTTWEKLCLANAVQRTGDQNWTAVGRAVKNIYDDTMVYLGNDARPSHWFSMKQCAAQYETLLNSVLGSRRKKRTDKSADPHEQPSHLIYNILKNEFLEELDRKIEEDRVLYRKMKKKQEDILAGHYDEKLEEMLAENALEKEKDIKLKLKFKLGEKNAERNANAMKSYTPSTPESEVVKTPGSNSSTSPLLTSLLQSPSQHSLPSTPSISLLLNSTPSTPSNESPTLSKLLESPSSKVPLNASSSLTPSALTALTSSNKSSVSSISQLDIGLRSHPNSKHVSSTSEARRHASPQKLVPPSAALKDGIHSEIVIDEEPLGKNEKQFQKSDNEEEVEEMEVVEEIVPEKSAQQGLDDTTQEKIDEEESKGRSHDDDKSDQVFDDDDDDKIDADILAEAKSVVDRRLSDSEVQDLSELSGDQIVAKGSKPKDSESNIDLKTNVGGKEQNISSKEVAHTSKLQALIRNQLDNEQSESDTSKRELDSSALKDERESDDNVEIGSLDQEAVEIIVMGSNTNSVVNVLSQDSSSEEIVQNSSIHERLKGLSVPDSSIHEESRTTLSKDEEEEDDETEDEKRSIPESPSGYDEETQSSVGTESKIRDDKEEVSSKEDDYMQGEDGSSKEGPISSRDECGDSSSVPDIMADQETTSDSAIAQSSPPMCISSRESLPEVKITLEPLEITLGQASFKEGIKNVPVLEEIRRQSSRKRSSAHLDSKPTSPALTFGDDEKEYRAWKKSVLLVFSRIASHKYASVFAKPITGTAGYKALIRCPMDLSTIKRNIETGVIRSTLDFQRDIMLMIQNAVVYNSHGSPVYSMAIEMWPDVLSQMNVMVQAVGDGVLLGDPVVQGETPSRPSRHAKLSLDTKKPSLTPPTHITPKRRKI